MYPFILRKQQVFCPPSRAAHIFPRYTRRFPLLMPYEPRRITQGIARAIAVRVPSDTTSVAKYGSCIRGVRERTCRVRRSGFTQTKDRLRVQSAHSGAGVGHPHQPSSSARETGHADPARARLLSATLSFIEHRCFHSSRSVVTASALSSPVKPRSDSTEFVGIGTDFNRGIYCHPEPTASAQGASRRLLEVAYAQF